MLLNKRLFYGMVYPRYAWAIVILVILGCGSWIAVDASAVTLDNATLAPSQVIPIIQHSASQEFPSTDGNRVVWQDARFGPTDIFMGNLAGGEPVNVTQSPAWEVQPAIDGEKIVWKDGYAGIGIHGIDLTTSAIFTVTTGRRDTSRPRLSGNFVVWADNRAGDNDWNIYGYDLAGATEFVITDAPGDQFDPQIDGPLVVWWDEQESIYLYNLETHQQQIIPDTHDTRLPDVSVADQLVIWQDMRNGNWDIYGYDLRQQQVVALVVAPRDQEYAVIDQGRIAFQGKSEGGTWNIHLLDLASHQYFPIDPHSAPQVQPAIRGQWVVWQDARNHHADIFAFAWNGIIPRIEPDAVTAPSDLQAGAFPAGNMLLQWQDHADNETGFVLERAAGITGTQWVEIAQLPANTTTYTERLPQLGESYWYRVRAYQDDSYSAYANESFNTTFADTPDLYELYLMTLINSARADPAVFGYPDYPPVPPLVYNPLVGYAAHSHSQAILNSGFQFGHCDLLGRCPSERARAVGYTSGCAENLTTTFRTGPEAMAEANQSFLDSEGHRNNMLAADLTEMGVGHTFDETKGDSNRHGQVTEVFCGNPDVTPPALPMGALFPYIGSTATTFTYLVNFYSAQPPTQAEVVIDGIAHPMTVTLGTASHGTYQYQQRLAAGQAHTFYFAFRLSDGQPARWPTAGVIPYPDVLPNPPQDPPARLPTFRHSLYLPQVRR